MKNQEIINLCQKIITGFDLNDKFGEDTDARHEAEVEAVSAVHAIIGKMQEGQPKLYQLIDSSGVEVAIIEARPEDYDEVCESWNDYHILEEHDKDPDDVGEFIEWHNENYLSQITRTFIEGSIG